MIRVHQHKVGNALHQHLRICGSGQFLVPLRRQHCTSGQRGDKGQLPQHLLRRADLCKGLAFHKTADAHRIQLFRDLRGGQLHRHLTVPLCRDGLVQRARSLGRSQPGKVRMLQKGVQCGAHLGGGQAVLRKEARALQRGLLGLVHDAGHADLGGHLCKGCRRVLPRKALPQLLHQCQVGLRHFILRICIRFLGQLHGIVAHPDSHHAFGLHKQQFPVAGKLPQHPAVRVHQQRRPQPVGKAVGLLVQRSPRPGSQKGRSLGKGLGALAAAHGHSEDELILCAGKRHIQKAHLLAAQLPGVDIGQRGVSGGLVGTLAVFRPQPQPRAESTVHQHRLTDIRSIELAGCIPHEYHRELQTLGAVDGHDRHAPRVHPAGHGVLSGAAGLRCGINGAHQRRDTACAGGGAEGGKAAGILPAAGTVFQHAQRRQITGGGKNFFQQLLRRGAACHLPQGGEVGIEVLHLLGKGVVSRVLQRQQECAVQADAGGLFVRLGLYLTAAGAQPHKVILGKAEHGAQHGGGQIDILRGVIDDLEQGDEGADVGRKHQVLPGIGIYRDAPGGQRLHIGRELGARCQQYAAVLVPHRAGGTALPHRLSGRNQLRDAFGDPARIGFRLIVRQKLHLHAALIFPGCTADQTLPVSVGGIAQFRGHELLKEIVDARHYLRCGAEVCIQRQQSVRARGALRRAGTGFCARQ